MRVARKWQWWQRAKDNYATSKVNVYNPYFEIASDSFTAN
jgi:hypothetical protein